MVILEFTRIGRLALANSEKASDEAVSGGASVRLEENPMLIQWGRIERAVANRMCAKAHQHHASLWLDERPSRFGPASDTAIIHAPVEMSWRTTPGRPRLADCWNLPGVLMVICIYAGDALQPRRPTYSTNRRKVAAGRGERHGPGTSFGG